MERKLFNWKFLNLIFVLFCLPLLSAIQAAQINGIVEDPVSGETLIGVSVKQKDSTNGTVTDFDGSFTIDVPMGSTLVFSYLGYVPVEVVVNSTTVNVKMKSDSQVLDEFVVIGYGVQKKSVVTAAIAQISAEELDKASPVRVDNALKGLAAGVTVTSASGQPGAASAIRIRGVGTVNNSSPLFIVDGMPIEGGLDYLNPSDIESIEVLKDAASGAVYGTRAANGVVLVTTKTGKSGKATIKYDFSYGWQRPWKEKDVLNATEYALLLNEGLVNNGQAPRYSDPYSLGTGTNWQKELFNYDAPVESHQISISGASDQVNYLLSASYYYQEGIVGGNFDRSNYQRFTFRSNTGYTIFDDSKEREFFNKLKLTSNISYARMKSKDIEANSSFGSPLGSALALSPLLPVHLEREAAQAQKDRYKDHTLLYDTKNGKLFTVPGSDYNEMVNPLASLSLPGDNKWTHKFLANFTAELNVWKNLVFRSSYGADLAFWGFDGYTKKYYLTSNNKSDKTKAYSEKQHSTTWQLENTLSYDNKIGGHSFAILLGQSAIKTKGDKLGGGRFGIVNLDKPYIDGSNGLQSDGLMNIFGRPHEDHRLASLFGRLSYNYDERYMLQATLRRDGSSRFGPNKKYKTFPSISLGWNILNEDFMKDRLKWLTTAKLRASWGQNGNERIPNFRYMELTSSNNNYIFGSNGTVVNGVVGGALPNPNLQWEQSEQIDLGLDLGFLDYALTFSVDYYEKKTNGMLMEMSVPSYIGAPLPWGNVGDMKNSGVEFEAAYKFDVNDWSFRVSGNASYLKNTLLEYGNISGAANLDSHQGTGTITRAENGKPFPFFYGRKTNGVFQNYDEINSYVNSKGELIQPNAQPGDVRFVDINGDGVIDDNDRTDIGNGMPKWTFGMNFSANWKNFDFSMMWQGTQGNDIFDATRRMDISSSNLPSSMLNRWTGEGTSNRYPRFVVGDNVNWVSSDLYIHDGSYLRLKNIQLGYTLPEAFTRKYFISSLRVFVAAENLLTFTKYQGFDPEISSGSSSIINDEAASSGGTSLGIDRGVYPQARTFTLGFNIGF